MATAAAAARAARRHRVGDDTRHARLKMQMQLFLVQQPHN